MKFAGKFLVFLFSLSLSLSSFLYATDIKNIGIPYVQNYTKEIYKSGNQNWSVTKDKNGVMYYGNSEGLLAFDGKYWQLYNMPNNLIVRAVASDNKGKIYVGGFGQFGYWSYNQKGVFSYTSLIHLVPKGLMDKDEIWKIYVDGNRILFQSFGCIYIYENNKITTVKGENHFLFLFKVGNRFFVEILKDGLYELKNNKLEFIKGCEVLGHTGILSILPYKNNSYLIGTGKNGLFIYDGNQFTPWSNQANDFLKTYQLNNGVAMFNKYFIYGTILNGIVILNDEGKIVQRINKASGLQNNTVLSLYADNEQNLWMGLDNGIDRVEINSPLYFYFDKNGVFGTVYSSLIHNNKIYLGTNQGLFSSNWSMNNENPFQSFDFKLINGSQGQVWDLSVIDGQLLCGHNDKTYRVEGTQLIKISDDGGGWTIKKLKTNPDFLIQGTYTGLIIYKKDNAGKWIFSNKVQGFNEPSRYVEQDDKGQIWVGHPYKGIYRLTLSDDLSKVTTSKYYDSRTGLPKDYQINIFNFNNRIVFSSDLGIYNYDELSDKFIRYDELNNRLGSFYSANNIIKASEKKYWFIDHGRVALADISQPGKFNIDSSRFNVLEGRMVNYYENINKINNSIYLISVDDGFAIYNSEVQAVDKIALPSVLIRRIENITDTILTAAESNLASEVLEIPYDQNNISITYSLPYYHQANIQYQFFLEGYSRQWSGWTTQTRKEFTNLKPGKYRFLVKAKVNEGASTTATVYEFVVLPPWYSTIWAYLTYLVLAVLLVLYIRHLSHLRLLKQQEKIKRKLELEKEEFLQKEMQANEQRIIQLKTQQLEADLSSKNRELANSTMNIVYKNELLQKISEEIIQLKDKDGKKLPAEQLRKIQTVINDGMNDERDWNLFENSFNEAHENFFKKLKAKHTDLSPNDLKLCAYLRMNMSSKELASILNITLRGVEIRRYRLRKKLNLEHDKNLAEFLMEL